MLPDDINAGCAELFDIWCERRVVRPLRHLLRTWPLTSGLTDDWGDLHEALRALRSDCRAAISEAEQVTVNDLIQAIAVNFFQR
ncbi:hypothetical protein ABH945_001196 [Paraburkholderia sp. GAS333]|uniref:hypothetical protein n=1 Tax=Paraburkholderia sp. GAS333 TaxID=3156279 RepID=UPI003D1C972E